MMKKSFLKKIITSILPMIFVSLVFSQAASVNADDSFYEDAMRWEQQGLVERLPNLRPYPLHLVRSILEQVASSENERAVKTANEHYERIFGKSIPITVIAGAEGIGKVSSSKTDDFNYHLAGNIGAAGSVQIANLFSYCYDAEITARKNDWLLPYAANLPADAIYDPATIGPLDAFTDVNMGFGFGKNDLYVTGGLMRSGYGPFWNEGLALNDSAYHQTNIAFVFMRPRWNYVHQISAVGATDMTGSLSSVTFGKFTSLHAIEVVLSKKISVSYYEQIVWGKRFDFTYILPIMYMIGQNISGADDNLQMGLLFEYTPAPWMNWATDVFIDDFSVNALVKLNLDAKYRFGLKTGFIFTPTDSIFEKITANYTLQTPYLYAHWDYEGNIGNKYYTAKSINYQNVTNAGQPLGSSLPPNSAKLSLGTTLKPLEDLKIKLDANVIRHANVCEGYTDEEAWSYLTQDAYKTDGSAFSSQMYGGTNNGVESAWDHLSFLSQDTTMYVFQAGITAEYKLPLPIKPDVSLNAGYVLEYIKNAGVDRDIWNYNDTLAEKYDKTEPTKEQMKEAVEDARNAWKAALYDVLNNYFSFSVKVMW